MSRYVLGISALYHDSAAALLKDGRLVAAASEERFSRVKHDPTLPIQAARSPAPRPPCPARAGRTRSRSSPWRPPRRSSC